MNVELTNMIGTLRLNLDFVEKVLSEQTSGPIPGVVLARLLIAVDDATREIELHLDNVRLARAGRPVLR